ncbi:UNVERIFIED_CONTAM: hypothetical protein GTU68_052403 [Idotea baltica]|nr:hypothetical protein [Idotea baltica]
MAYHYPSCDLYIGASGSEVYRLNLHQGKFLNSLQTDSPSINKCIFNPVHYLLTCGTEDGRVETWDPRSRHRVGVLDCALHMIQENIQLPMYKSAKDLGITSLAYNDALTLGVGTQTGQILLYDIRSKQPMLIKDHMDGFPIKDLEFHSKYGMVLSMASNVLKVWHKDSGKPHTSIESDVKFNDLCSIQDSGMVSSPQKTQKCKSISCPVWVRLRSGAAILML